MLIIYLNYIAKTSPIFNDATVNVGREHHLRLAQNVLRRRPCCGPPLSITGQSRP
jgi:hypothetical protein